MLHSKTILTALFAGLTLCASAFGGTITGQVVNGTTSKPAAGEEVAILALSQGMQEIAHTKSDAAGNFKVDIPDDGTPHMVRVEHQGVSYFPKGGPLMPGATSATVQIYDVAKKLDVSTTVNVMRVQADATTLQATELYAVQNSSSPAKTMFDADKTYEFTLPDGAVVDSAAARTQDGQPVNTAAMPLKEKNHYAFVFPLRPGETQFQISYHMPYKGEVSFAPKIVTAMQHYVVMFPKSMKFESKSASTYAPMNDDTGSGIQVASNVKPGAELGFKLSGTGAIAEAGQGGQGGPAEGGGPSAGQAGRPGGGLGPPIEAPDPLEKYRWVILAIIVVAMLGAAFIVSRRNAPQPAPVEEAEEDITGPPQIPEALNAPAAPRTDRATQFLDTMKEELFQLEVDHAQGKMSDAEYEKVKAALNETLKRALARKSQTSA